MASPFLINIPPKIQERNCANKKVLFYTPQYFVVFAEYAFCNFVINVADFNKWIVFFCLLLLYCIIQNILLY